MPVVYPSVCEHNSSRCAVLLTVAMRFISRHRPMFKQLRTDPNLKFKAPTSKMRTQYKSRCEQVVDMKGITSDMRDRRRATVCCSQPESSANVRQTTECQVRWKPRWRLRAAEMEEQYDEVDPPLSRSREWCKLLLL